MKSSADTPIYNLKAVVQETDLKPDTLRAWERRYGLPNPQRTESGHRLYSQNDIELLKWLIARQDEGMSISRAVDLWRQLSAENQNPLQTLSRHSEPAPPATPLPPVLRETTREPETVQHTLTEFRQEWLQSCLNFDEQHAEQVISQAFALFPIEQVLIELLQEGIAAIGRSWYAGEITIQQEHFASGLANRRMEALLAATPRPTRAGRVLMGCPPQESHTFTPLLMTLLLRRRGWDVLYLGANVPIQNFVETIERVQPQLIILSAQQLVTAVGIRELGEHIYAAEVPMGYGGLIFTQLPELQRQITGHFLGNTISGALEVAEQLMAMPRLPLPAPPLPTHHDEALTYFQAHHAEIDAEVWRRASELSMPHKMLQQANINFSRDIIAALTLGDIRFLGVDMAWIKGLLWNHHQMPEQAIQEYLQIYLRATEHVLQGRGAILINWLQQILRENEADTSTDEKG